MVTLGTDLYRTEEGTDEETRVFQDLMCQQVCGKSYTELLENANLPDIPREIAAATEYDHQRDAANSRKIDYLKTATFARLFDKLGSESM